MDTTGTPGFTYLSEFTGPLVATAIHTGHGLRPEIAAEMVLDEQVRFREEDPFTDRIAGQLPEVLRVDRSRFEVDLNRPRDKAVYQTPDDCWGLDVWRAGRLSDELTEGSLAEYDAFYAELGRRLDQVAARGPFVLYDVHSYNHRRPGADADPEPIADNPEVNVGTGSLDRDRWAPVVEAFNSAMADDGAIDVRENVKFQGANLAAWVHERYPETGCVLALEFKKTFMDEWTGEPDTARIQYLADVLAGTREPVLAALSQVR